MKLTHVITEFKGRLNTELDTKLRDFRLFQEKPKEEILKNYEREVAVLDEMLNTVTFSSPEEFLKYVSKDKDKTLQAITKSGTTIEFMVDVEQVAIPEALRNFTKKFAKEPSESEPALLNQRGLYLTPPHGELLWNGKKSAMVKSIKIGHINEPVYLLSGKYCYGIINVDEPKQINLNQFKSLANKHQITDTERQKWWPNKDVLYYYPIKFVRRWEVPKEWQVKKGAQIWVENVKFEEISNSARFIFMLQEDQTKRDDETREGGIEAEMKRYGDWYKVKVDPKKTYRYVAQHHSRGDSMHTDLRMEINDHLIGWTLDTPGSKTNPKHDKFLKPVTPSQGVDYQALAERKLIQPKVWLTVKGQIEAGGIGATKYKPADFEIVSSGIVKFGVQKHDFHEYFLYPDKKWAQSDLKGRWIASYIPRPSHYERAGEGKFMWGFWRPNDQRPYVEYQNYDEAVEKARKEKGYMIWQHPEKGELQESVDFREDKKSNWTYK